MNDQNNQLVSSESGVQFAPPQNQSTAVVQIEQTRASQEVQAAMVVAKKYPRKLEEVYAEIMTSCDRASLANIAIYKYPKGGKIVKGVSIHLAKALASAWGNLDFGIRELSQSNGESVVESYCWDLQKNNRETKTFTVKHERHTKTGKKTLTDPRDIYETVANNGARRLRSCIIGIVPKDIVDAAEARCYATMKLEGKGDKPLCDRIREFVSYFKSKGIDEKMLEKHVGHELSTMDETELLDLRMIANSLKSGEAKREDFFDLGGAGAGHAGDLNKEFQTQKNNSLDSAEELKSNTKNSPKENQEAQTTEDIKAAPKEKSVSDMSDEEFKAKLKSKKK